MSTEFTLLLITAISLAFIHTLAGPDHYLPFIVLSKARKWSWRKTAWFTVLCGLGHVGSSILVGLIGITFGFALPRLVLFESERGSLISWGLLAFGLVYLVWGIWRLLRNRPHTHSHFHRAGEEHSHEHNHHDVHLHIHEQKGAQKLTPWILFTIFVLGPCEPLIPVLMYPAAKHDFTELFVVTGAFCVITVLTMLAAVSVAYFGIRLIDLSPIEKYSHVIASSTIVMCGMGMVFFGL